VAVLIELQERLEAKYKVGHDLLYLLYNFISFSMMWMVLCSTPDILALFTSGQKQNGFASHSGHIRIKRSCGSAKHEESCKVLFLTVGKGTRQLLKLFLMNKNDKITKTCKTVLFTTITEAVIA
jgi:hypothetical protein